MAAPTVKDPPTYPYWTYKNRHLTPGIRPYWSYDGNFTSAPLAYQELPSNNQSLSSDYNNWLKQEKTVPFPVMLRRGGMSENSAMAIQDGALNFPDLKSTTLRNTAFFQQIIDSLPPIKPYSC